MAGRGLGRHVSRPERQDGVGGADIAAGVGERAPEGEVVHRPGLEGGQRDFPEPGRIARLGEAGGGRAEVLRANRPGRSGGCDLHEGLGAGARVGGQRRFDRSCSGAVERIGAAEGEQVGRGFQAVTHRRESSGRLEEGSPLRRRLGQDGEKGGDRQCAGLVVPGAGEHLGGSQPKTGPRVGVGLASRPVEQRPCRPARDLHGLLARGAGAGRVAGSGLQRGGGGQCGPQFLRGRVRGRVVQAGGRLGRGRPRRGKTGQRHLQLGGGKPGRRFLGQAKELARPAGIPGLGARRGRSEGQEAGPAPARTEPVGVASEPFQRSGPVGVDAEAPGHDLCVVRAQLEEPVQRLHGEGGIARLLGQLGQRRKPIGLRARVEGRLAGREERLVQCQRLADRAARVQELGQHLAHEEQVSGTLVGLASSPQRAGAVALLASEQGGVAPGPGGGGRIRRPAREGLERFAPRTPSQGRWRGSPERGVLRGERDLGGKAGEGLAETGVGLGEAAGVGQQSRPFEQSPTGAGGIERRQTVEEADHRGTIPDLAGDGEAGLGGGQVAGRERPGLLGVGARGRDVVRGERQLGEAQEEGGALSSRRSRDEPGQRKALAGRVGVLAGDGDERRPGVAGLVAPQPEVERCTNRALPLHRQPGGERRLPGQGQSQRGVGLSAGPRVGRRLEQVERRGAGALPEAEVNASVAARRVAKAGDAGGGPARGGQRGRQEFRERALARKGLAGQGRHLQAHERAGQRPELRGAAARVEGRRCAVDLQLQIQEGNSALEPCARQADPDPPPRQPEFQAGGAGVGNSIGQEDVGHGGRILPWIGPPRELPATSAAPPRPAPGGGR